VDVGDPRFDVNKDAFEGRLLDRRRWRPARSQRILKLLMLALL